MELIKLDTNSDLILPNMAATAVIIDTVTDALSVPSGSLVTRNNDIKVKTAGKWKRSCCTG